MSTKKMIVSGSIIGFVLLMITGYSMANAVKTYFSGQEIFVEYLMPPQFVILPSGNIKGEFETLYYEDTDNERINGYGFVHGTANVNTKGVVQYGGTFIIREKLDDIPVSDIANGTLDPEEIQWGDVLWNGTWRNVGSGENSYIKAVLHSPDGAKLFYNLDHATGETSGYVLDPQ